MGWPVSLSIGGHGRKPVPNFLGLCVQFCFLHSASVVFLQWWVGARQAARLVLTDLPFPLAAGEMSHHDVLDAASQGVTVVLCEHSNTERGFLSDLRDMLRAHLENKIDIILSEADRDPLCVA